MLSEGMLKAAAMDDAKGDRSSLSGLQPPATSIPGASKDNSCSRAVKSQRISEAHHVGAARYQLSFTMVMTMHQERAGTFVIHASLQQDQPRDTGAAAAFTAKCHAIQQDLEQLTASMR